MEARRLIARQVRLLPQEVCAGQGRMAAQVDLGGGREPTQAETVLAALQEGGFREVHFARDILHPVVARTFVQ